MPAGLLNHARTSSRADEKRKRVRALRYQGLTICAITNETGYSVGTVHRYATKAQEKSS
ncbi:hypothetical protein [Corynebacterium propinquum]